MTREPIAVEAVTHKVLHPHHGAALTFIGTTREFTYGKRTTLLEYEAYEPMAIKTMRQICDEISGRWPGTLTAITHRLGTVPVGEISVVIAVSSPHRDAAYEASRYAIERLKQIVPIWKKEVWEDGSEWKGHQQGPWDPRGMPAASPHDSQHPANKGGITS
ncbi:molybdenum cofactor biosynthesis protein MoaE [Paenibacillus sp. P26]|nr:molybdenum cofactor biosynthesis protein MoaE [Paenibacillus sp. P26]UUZ97790.1 molybdenum cofactor biosynthesis protein MoaE [Paenibacillus sp. P25]